MIEQTPGTDPRLLFDEETAEIVDRLLGEFLLSCMGKNDMKVVQALLASAALMIVTHCERTGQNVDEITTLAQDIFAMSLEIASRRSKL